MDEEIKFTFSSLKTNETATTTVEMIKWVPVDAPWTEAAKLFMQFMRQQYAIDVDVHLSPDPRDLSKNVTTTTGTWGAENAIDIKMST